MAVALVLAANASPAGAHAQSAGSCSGAERGAATASSSRSALRTDGRRAAPLPSRGRLLVEVPGQGTLIVRRDGSRRPLGQWFDAAWSPDGAFVAAVRGRTLAVLDSAGGVITSLRAPTPGAGQPDWSADSLRLAYRAGTTLRVVARDGSGGRRVARRVAFAGPRWRPGKGYALAWSDRHGRVRVVDVAARRTLWMSGSGPPVRPHGLHWSRTGTTIAAISGSQVRVFDGADGRLLRRVHATGSDHFQGGAFAPTGSSRLALIRHDFSNGGARVTIVPARRRGGNERVLFAGRGRVIDATFSPDGRRLLLGWRGGDQWRFVPVKRGVRVAVVRRVTRRFSPSPGGRWAFPHVRGWCCSP